MQRACVNTLAPTEFVQDVHRVGTLASEADICLLNYAGLDFEDHITNCRARVYDADLRAS